LRRTVLTVKLAAAAAVAVLAGGVAAAYADALPPALQKIAHMSIAAPAARSHPSHPSHPSGHSASATPGTHRTQPAGVGPDPAGHAAHGLCTAYLNAKKHGSAAQQDVATRNLVAAAGGAGKVAAYCAGVPQPGASSPGKSASHGNGNGNGNGNGGGNGNGNGNGNGQPSAGSDHTPPGQAKKSQAASQ
jgi:hypothetical protein